MDSLGNPQNAYKTIHVAGTNGKGSVCALIYSVLKESGFKVGLYTSPHLMKFNERIKINGKEISDKEIVEYTKLLKQKSEELGIQPTFFEFTTAMAFLHFAKKVDIAVIETGMGGRLDATNIINPLVSVITNIDFDHMQILGDTKEKIASEKAGIIKTSPVITGEKDPEIIEIFRKVCDKNNTNLITTENLKSEILESTLEKQVFKINGKKFEIHLLGKYQIENSKTAYLALKTIGVSDQNIGKGFENVCWPGRLQILSKKPLVIVDGTHNSAGLGATYEFVKKLQNRKVLVLGIAEDKPLEEFVSKLCPIFETTITTEGNFKPADCRLIEEDAKKYSKNVEAIKSVKKAVQKALSLVKEDETIFITGSLYMVGDAMNALKLGKTRFSL